MNTLEARRRLLGRNVYKRTTEGNPAIAQGSLARMYPGITMQGWTKQNQYEGKNLFDIESAKNPENYVEGAYGYLGLEIPAQVGKTYTFNRNLANGYGLGLGSAGLKQDNNDSVMSWLVGDTNESLNNSAASLLATQDKFYFATNQRDPEFLKQLIETCFESPMLNEGSTALPYEPYVGNAPSPSPEYPQEIVSAGKYNEDTQKWEYEITIANAQTDATKNQTVTLTADRPLTKWDKLEKRGGQWGWVYKSAEVVLDGSVDENWFHQSDSNKKKQFYILLSDALYPYSDPFKEMFYCDTFLTTNNLGAIPKWQVRKGSYKGLAPVFKPSDDIDTVEAFRNFLAENQTTILYVTKEETFIPLSESEQEQMNTLHTYYPTTVLSNDCGCNMTLTYKTKKSLEVAT